MAIETKREKNERKNKSKFIGREKLFEDLDIKLKNIRNEEYSVVNYYGLGGIGKSTLIKEIKIRYKNDENLIFSYNFDSKDSDKPSELYQDLLEFFHNNKIDKDYLSIAFMIYFKKKNPNVEILEKFPFFDEYRDILSEYSEFLEIEGSKLLNSAIKSVIKIGQAVHRKFVLDKEVMNELKELKDLEPKDIEEQFPYFLSKDIERYFKENQNKKIIFLLDTYEKLWKDYRNDDFKNEVDDWISEIVLELRNTNTIFVIAGREELKWQNKDEAWNEYIEKRPLDVFTEEESIKFLNNSGVEDKIAKNIAKISGGYPFYLELFLDVYKQDTNKDSFDDLVNKEKILGRFKEHLGNNQVRILEKLSMLRLFDKKLYEYITKEQQSESFFNELILYSFVEKMGNNYKIHNILSDSFKNSLSQDEKDNINLEFFNYYNIQIEREGKNFSYYEDALFHLLDLPYDKKSILAWFENVKASFIKDGEYENLMQLYETAIRKIDKTKELYFEFQIELLELYSNLRKYKEAYEIIEFLEDSNIPDNLLDNVNYYENYIKFKKNQGNITKSENKRLRTLLFNSFSKISDKTLSEKIKIEAIIQSAKIKRYLSSYEDSKILLNKALEICKDKDLEANIYEDLSTLYIDVKEYNNALKYIEMALKLKNKIYNEEHLEIGKSYRELSKILISKNSFEGASEIVLKTIKIFSKYYSIYSSDMSAEYNKLYGILGKEAFLACDEIDTNMKYLTLIKEDLDNGQQYIDILLKRCKDSDEYVETLIRISKCLDNKERVEILESIEYDKLDYSNKHKILQQKYYFIKDDKKDTQVQLKYLNDLVEISKEVSFDKYIYELHRLSYFHYKQENYDAVEKCYSKILVKLDNKYKNRYKIMDIYEKYRFLYIKLDNKEKFRNILQEEIGILEKYEEWHKLAQAIRSKNVFNKREKQFDEIEKTLLEIKELYKNKKDLNRVDSTCGKLIEFYEKLNKLDKALELYKEQIKIRTEQNQFEKLSRAYKYIADFYLFKLHNPTDGMKELEKGFNIFINDKNKLSPETMNLYLINMQNYCKYIDKDEIEILDLRLGLVKGKNGLIELKVYEDFIKYYEKNNNLEKIFEYIKYALNISKSLKDSKKMLEILEKKSEILLKENRKDEYLKSLFEIYNLKILVKDKKTIECLQEIKDFNFKNNILPMKKFIDIVNKELFTLIKLNSLSEYVNSMIILKDIQDINLFGLYIYHVKSIKQRVKEISILEKISDSFFKKDEKMAASFFYYEFIELKLGQIKAQFDKQKVFYEESLLKMNSFGNKKLYKEHKLRYDRFKERMSRTNIVNGRAIDSILLNSINKISPITMKENRDIIIGKLEEYTKLFLEDELILEKIINKKLAQSVFTQGFYCVVKNFDLYKLGITNTEPLIAYLLTNTKYCNVFINNAPNIIRREDFVDAYTKTEDITNFEDYINKPERYKELLNNIFFNTEEEEGIYFPLDEVIMKKILKYLGDNNHLFIDIKFQDIVDKVVEEFNLSDTNDILRTENIIKNLCYLDIFEEDLIYKDFEEKLFTLDSNYNDIVRQIKEKSRQILENKLTNIDNINFAQVFLFL